MTIRPVVWKRPFIANDGATAGHQTAPQTIGLANGNILVVWEDSTHGPSPGIDVMGRIYTPEGRPLSAPMQINSAVVASDETGPKIVALPDGGFVMAYGSYFETTGGFIAVQRYNANGDSLFSNLILDDLSSLTKWEVTADPAGDYAVVYEKQSPPGDVNVYSVTFDGSTNARGPERRAAENSGEDDALGAVASFANGHLLTFAASPDDDFAGNPISIAELTITDPATGTVIRGPAHVAGDADFFTDDYAYPRDAAVLAGGQFVLLYAFRDGEYDPSGGTSYTRSLQMRIYASETGPFTEPVTVAVANGSGAYGFNGHVVALSNGDFYVVWSPDRPDHNAEVPLRGQRFSPTGERVGSPSLLDLNVTASGFEQTRLSLTYDGRILVTYRNTAGEVVVQILDPRVGDVVGTGSDDALTARVSGTQMLGEGGRDTLLGQNGNDTLDGGAGADTLRGGNGDDTYVLKDVRPGSFDYDAVVESFNRGIDTVEVRLVELPGGAAQFSYTLGAHVENGIVAGVETFDLFGNGLANRLTGNGAANALGGGSGNDVLNGGAGADTMAGGLGDDLFYVDDAGDAIVEADGQGTDRVASSVSFSLAGQAIENLTLGGTQGSNATGNALGNSLTGNAAANRLTGLGGNDRLDGGAGNDVLSGGDGADVFAFRPGAGNDRVLAFTDTGGGTDDRLDLRAYNFASAAAIARTASGDDLVLNLGGGDTVRLVDYLATHTANQINDDILI